MRVPRLIVVAVGALRAHRRCGRQLPGPGRGDIGRFGGRRAPRLRVCFGCPGSALADVSVSPGVIHVGRAQSGPPTTADCEKSYKVACYEPAQIQQAYNLPAVYASGVTGKGATIVIVDSYGSPTIRDDLSVVRPDIRSARPAVASRSSSPPARSRPTTRPTPTWSAGPGRPRWTWSTAHTIAPGANILLVETPVSETEGVHGFPQIVTAEEYVLKHHLGDVISQSFSATEETFPPRPPSRRCAAPTRAGLPGPRHGARRLGRLRRRRRRAGRSDLLHCSR